MIPTYDFAVQICDSITNSLHFEWEALSLFPNGYSRAARFCDPRGKFPDLYVRMIDGIGRKGSRIVFIVRSIIVDYLLQHTFDVKIISNVMAAPLPNSAGKKYCVCFNCIDENGKYSMYMKMPISLYRKFLNNNMDVPGVQQLLTELIL